MQATRGWELHELKVQINDSRNNIMEYSREMFDTSPSIDMGFQEMWGPLDRDWSFNGHPWITLHWLSPMLINTFTYIALNCINDNNGLIVGSSRMIGFAKMMLSRGGHPTPNSRVSGERHNKSQQPQIRVHKCRIILFLVSNYLVDIFSFFFLLCLDF